MLMSSCLRGLGYGNELAMDVFSSVGGRGDGIIFMWDFALSTYH